MVESLLDFFIQIATCNENDCPGTAFTVVGAAFATQGYYLESMIISLIGAGGWEMWAVFIYMFSAFAFFIMIVINGLSIPKNVMWFVLGPALFGWMVYTPWDNGVKGVGWKVGDSYINAQERVWEIAEPGLRNLDPIQSGGDLADTKGTAAEVNKQEPVTIHVSWLFGFWDWLISDTVIQLTKFVGADELRTGNGVSNLGEPSTSTLKSNRVNPAVISNIKWGKLQAITSARITTPGMKDAFVEYFSGACGYKIKAFLSKEKLVTARRGSLGFSGSSINVNDVGILKDQSSSKLKQELDSTMIPVNGSMRNLIKNVNTGGTSSGGSGNGTSLEAFLEQTCKEDVKKIVEPETKEIGNMVSCSPPLVVLMNALKWEISQIYHKMMQDWDNYGSGKEDDLLAAFYYGWNLDRSEGGGGRIDKANLKKFTRELIFAYLMKNELEFLPTINKYQFSTQVQAEQSADTHIQSLGSQNKYGEIYTWARMMPYIQGILMFILAGAYPIACIIFLIPGCHKVIITWAAFWAWVKFWDVGFAIVTVIERNLWGILGNSEQAATSNRTIIKIMSDGSTGYGSTNVQCGSGGLGSCPFPEVTDGGIQISDVNRAIGAFDKLSGVGLSLNYGVNNGYYIYIMAALYMAVPVICGQVFLQGKHGVGGLASMMTGGAERGAGGAAESAAKAKGAAAITQTVATAERQAKADAAKSFALSAMEAGNRATSAGVTQGAYKAGMDARDLIGKKGWKAALLGGGLAFVSQAAEAGDSGWGWFATVGKNLKEDFEKLQTGGFGAAGKWGMIGNVITGNGPIPSSTGVTGDDGDDKDRKVDKDKFSWKSAPKFVGASMDYYANSQGFAYSNEATRWKGFADRQNTMARYAGDMAGYEMKSELASSMQHIAGVYGVNLQPSQKPYDIQGMMGAGEIEYVDDKGNEHSGMSAFAYFDEGNRFQKFSLAQQHSVTTAGILPVTTIDKVYIGGDQVSGPGTKGNPRKNNKP